MKVREDTLRKKGWSETDITEAKAVIERADKEKSFRKKLFEEIVLWGLLGLLSAGSLVGAWIAQPVLLILSVRQSIIALAFIGVLFGLFAGWIISELEELESHHHLFMTISIPVVAVGSALLINSRIQRMVAATPAFAGVEHNPYILAITYALATIIPYSIILYMEKRRYETR